MNVLVSIISFSFLLCSSSALQTRIIPTHARLFALNNHGGMISDEHRAFKREKIRTQRNLSWYGSNYSSHSRSLRPLQGAALSVGPNVGYLFNLINAKEKVKKGILKKDDIPKWLKFHLYPKEIKDSVKLATGVVGIYCAFIYYGSLQEDVFRYISPTNNLPFKYVWLLQVIEALVNVICGFIGLVVTGRTKRIPLAMFGISGASQVSAKAFTSLALANGLSFPVATLAKSGKMAPVMAGSLLLGGAKYSLLEYLNVIAIICGTAIVGLGKKKGGSTSTLGIIYIFASLVMDGVTAGFQKRLKVETAKAGVKPKPYDFMFWTNLFMLLAATLVATALGEITPGLSYLITNPEILKKILKFAACSAIGQSFIFFTISNFDPLVLSTVTTTRKIFSVLLSILLKGHSLSATGWSGIALACGGILSEMRVKITGKNENLH